MNGDWVLITPPAEEPVTLAEAMAQCRVEDAAENDLITGLMLAGRDQVESITRRAILTQTWELVLDAWPQDRVIELPRPPLQSVESITYLDGAGVTQTLSAEQYQVATVSAPGRVVLARGASWPSVELAPVEAIRVRFVAGWADAASVPAPLKLAIKLLVGHWYENREEVSVGAGVAQSQIPYGVDALLASYRVLTF